LRARQILIFSRDIDNGVGMSKKESKQAKRYTLTEVKERFFPHRDIESLEQDALSYNRESDSEKEQRNDLKDKQPPPLGKPVKILYLDDKSHMLL
jgi:hypothetical protein